MFKLKNLCKELSKLTNNERYSKYVTSTRGRQTVKYMMTVVGDEIQDRQREKQQPRTTHIKEK